MGMWNFGLVVWNLWDKNLGKNWKKILLGIRCNNVMLGSKFWLVNFVF